MVKKQVVLLFALLLTIPMAALFAQQPAAKPARWEGKIVRSDKAGSTLTVRKSGSSIEKTVMYDSSTKWVSQYHGDKKVNEIQPGDVKDDDYVICTGTYGEKGVIHATMISKRLSHSPAAS